MSAPFTGIQNAMAGIVFKGTGQLKQTGFQNPQSNNFDAGYSFNYSIGKSAAGLTNKMIDLVRTIAASGTDTVDLTGALADLLGQSAASVSAIVALCIQLLATGETVNGVAGTDCSSITIGAAGSNPWAAILDAAATYTINNGGVWFHADFTPSGLAVASGASENLKIVNNDSTHGAAYRLSAFVWD